MHANEIMLWNSVWPSMHCVLVTQPRGMNTTI